MSCHVMSCHVCHVMSCHVMSCHVMYVMYVMSYHLGPTPAAGAIIDSNTITRAHHHGIHAQSYLQRHDSYHFFNELDQYEAVERVGSCYGGTCYVMLCYVMLYY